jgi:hypothetical protein
MTREEALDILDCFIFENIDNHHNFSEDTHSITWHGLHFAVLEHATGQVQTFKIEYTLSDLPVEKWKKLAEDQEWEYKISGEDY